jgi:hypothetical protein
MHVVRVALAVVLASLAVPAQDHAAMQAADAAERAARRALSGDLGLPELPPLRADSPLDRMLFADRVMVPQDQVPTTDTPPGTMLDGNLPAGPNGTGTDKAEPFKYQIPWNYQPGNAPVPLVIGYHGFGLSPGSVALQSTLDEESNERGWFYMAPTGIDDILYGSTPCQQNVSAAIQWMLDNFDIDPDRIYMVGFSMGGGVALNYTARHRDPHGIMIAALGIVSATMDWTLEYATNNSTIKSLLENPYNFGGTPSSVPFAYQAASSLYFQSGSYPPLPGLLDIGNSMAVNLGSTPTYVTWDLQDTIPAVLAEEPVLVGVLAGLGGSFVSKPVTGTPSPKHSWTVLNEPDLFDFFAGKVVNRAPLGFEALIDRDSAVGWSSVQQAAPLVFTHVNGVASLATRSLSVSNVTNAGVLRVHADLAGIPGSAEVRASGTAGLSGYLLDVCDSAVPPAWLETPGTNSMLLGIQSDPAHDGLLVPVPALGSTSADAHLDPDYVADLSTTPQPAHIGQPITLHLDGPDGATSAFLLLGVAQAKGFFKGGHVALVQFGAPTVVAPVPLQAGGLLNATSTLPNDAGLHGLQVLVQALLADGSGLNSISNLWLMDID